MKKIDSLANILIVDDDLNVLTVMEEILSGSDRLIFTTSSGEEALRYLLQQDFALILLEVRIRGMDGFETAELIRQRLRSRYTPLIFMSGTQILGEDLILGIRKGAVDYLLKPFTPELLKSKVETYVNLFHLHNQLKYQAIQKLDDTDGCSILTLRKNLLVVLLTGFINLERFKNLESRLLNHTLNTKPKAIVIDATGASLDIGTISSINTSIREIERMGVFLIGTGKNTSISNAMLVSNVKFDGVFNATDLKAGIEAAISLFCQG
jgi:CheY-like chemotaxis protein